MPAPFFAQVAVLVCAFGFVAGCDGSSNGGSAHHIDPSKLPRLGPGSHVGIVYSAPAPGAQAALDIAFDQALAEGVNTYQLAIPWWALEATPGTIDTTPLEVLLDTVTAAGLVPYLGITTIDTVQLSLPTDFVDMLDSTELAPGVSFDDPTLIARFEALLDQVVPLLIAHGGFLLVIGNEVENWLAVRPGEVQPYLTFLDAARAHVRTLDARLAVGVSTGFPILTDHPTLFAQLHAATDTVAFTYYPVAGDFTVLDPSVVSTQVGAMLAAVAPGPLVLQEVGYPAGYTSGPNNGSSQERQRQFVANIFAEIRTQPRLRFVSFLHLADWSPAELDVFETYYGFSDPIFREYLGTLGLRENADGAPKSAWPEFIAGLQSL